MAAELEYPGWLHGYQDALVGLIGKEQFGECEAVLFSGLVIYLLLLFTYLATRRLEKIPTGLQNLAELVVELFSRFCKAVIGPHGLDFLPLIGTLFIYIFCLNLLGLVPGFKSPTSNVNVTFSLALVTFWHTHYYGLKYQGFGYIKHFAGEPRWLAPLMVITHIAGELARPVSLTFRLFGNIMGEDTAIAIFSGLGLSTGLFLPFQLPLMALAVFTSLIQALVFAMLSSIYISGATTVHGHGGAHGEAQGEAHGRAAAPVPGHVSQAVAHA